MRCLPISSSSPCPNRAGDLQISLCASRRHSPGKFQQSSFIASQPLLAMKSVSPALPGAAHWMFSLWNSFQDFVRKSLHIELPVFRGLERLRNSSHECHILQGAVDAAVQLLGDYHSSLFQRAEQDGGQCPDDVPEVPPALRQHAKLEGSRCRITIWTGICNTHIPYKVSIHWIIK